MSDEIVRSYDEGRISDFIPVPITESKLGAVLKQWTQERGDFGSLDSLSSASCNGMTLSPILSPSIDDFFITHSERCHSPEFQIPTTLIKPGMLEHTSHPLLSVRPTVCEPETFQFKKNKDEMVMNRFTSIAPLGTARLQFLSMEGCKLPTQYPKNTSVEDATQ